MLVTDVTSTDCVESRIVAYAPRLNDQNLVCEPAMLLAYVKATLIFTVEVDLKVENVRHS